MQESSRDPAIKLFGQKIPLPDEGDLPTAAADNEEEDSAPLVSMEVDRPEGESDGDDGEQRNSEEEKDPEDKV